MESHKQASEKLDIIKSFEADGSKAMVLMERNAFNSLSMVLNIPSHECHLRLLHIATFV